MDPASLRVPRHVLRVDLHAKYKVEAVYESRKWTAFQFKVYEPITKVTYKVWTNARKRNEYWLRACSAPYDEDFEEPACSSQGLLVSRARLNAFVLNSMSDVSSSSFL